MSERPYQPFYVVTIEVITADSQQYRNAFRVADEFRPADFYDEMKAQAREEVEGMGMTVVSVRVVEQHHAMDRSYPAYADEGAGQ